MPASAHVHNVQNLFRSAFHVSRSENEQNAALAKLRKVLSTHIDVLDIEMVERKASNDTTKIARSSTSQIITPVQNPVVNNLMTEIQALRNENRALQARIAEFEAAQADPFDRQVRRVVELEDRNAELEARIAELEASQAEPAAVSDAGEEYLPWVVFEAEAAQTFGRDAWKSIAAFELDMDVKTLNAWQTVGIIPAKFVGVVKSLTEDQKAPASRKQWGDTEYERLKALVDEGHRDREIAKILSRDFGRRLVETSITGARRRLRAR